jgi:hypothetical protein
LFKINVWLLYRTGKGIYFSDNCSGTNIEDYAPLAKANRKKTKKRRRFCILGSRTHKHNGIDIFNMKRNRIVYLLLIVITILAGLGSRHYGGHLPSWVYLYLGDSLWALMVFWMAGFLLRQKTTGWVAVVSLLFSYIIETSQLYHAPWIDAIRATTLGGLVLGFGFLWSDMLCYTVGIAFGIATEIVFLNKMRINRLA